MNKIFWFTAQSGAGKTTLAKEFAKEIDAIILDGDEMRESISLDAGFSRTDRKEHNLRVARLAKVLAKQSNVIVSVIAPMEEVRKEITKICNPKWIYIKRTLPEREGHFYEEPSKYSVMLNHDVLSIKESLRTLTQIYKSKKKYSLFIGRWQCIPLHKGHLALFDKIRKEGKKILIAIRDTEIDEQNPYTIQERMESIKKVVPDAEVIVIPNINEICYGRGVGYGIREITLDDDLQKISATKIRGESKLN